MPSFSRPDTKPSKTKRILPRLTGWLKRPIRINAGIIVFIFLEGATISVPIGFLTQGLRPYELPEWVGYAYCGTVAASIVLLQLWSFSSWVEENGLTQLGLATFVATLLLLLFFPPIGN